MGERHTNLQGLLTVAPDGRGTPSSSRRQGDWRPLSALSDGGGAGSLTQTASRGQSVRRGAGLGRQETQALSLNTSVLPGEEQQPQRSCLGRRAARPPP